MTITRNSQISNKYTQNVFAASWANNQPLRHNRLVYDKHFVEL